MSIAGWTARNVAGAGLALALSVGLHLSGAGYFALQETVDVDGGGSVEPARLGTSFADMVAGNIGANAAEPETTEPIESDEVEEPIETIEELPPEPVEEVTESAEQSDTLPTASKVAEAAEQAEATPAAETRTTDASDHTTLEATRPNETVIAETPEAMIDAVPPAQSQPSDPLPSANTAQAEVTAAEPAETALSAEPSAIVGDVTVATSSAVAAPTLSTVAPSPAPAVEPVQPVVTAALPKPAPPSSPLSVEPPADAAQPVQPNTLTEAVVAAPVDVQTPGPDTPRPAARPQRQTQPAPSPQATGNAAQDQRRGQASGTDEGTSAAQSNRQSQSQQAGSAAIRNYPGLVMRQIQKVRRPRVRAKQPAQVIFSIAANGSLSVVRIRRSSGNAEFDAAVVAFIRKAAPFPPPPKGARTNYDLVIEPR